MKTAFINIIALATAAFAGPVAGAKLQLLKRDVTDPTSALTTLTSTVKVHTAIINATLATITNTTATSNANVTGELNLITLALNSSALALASTKRSAPLFDRAAVAARSCDATCQETVYDQLGSLSSEIAYTMQGCIEKNVVDTTTGATVLVNVVKALDSLTIDMDKTVTVGGVAGVVVQSLQAGMGAEIGGALSALIQA